MRFFHVVRLIHVYFHLSIVMQKQLDDLLEDTNRENDEKKHLIKVRWYVLVPCIITREAAASQQAAKWNNVEKG